ncbi:hypothetical protein PIB30_077566 [Stylosanthes scabra]|uniref:Transposase (Putative), gypsy type n=1 Tax=Stylosanthes scabra TaxID=79078 RepID=A0ABU6QQM5_9FABA|nr:hypothetical protein [Stylosanthes scabra]
MGKKKSCQEVIVPRPLDVTETRLYGWVEKVVLTQQSVVENDALSEFRRRYPLMEDSGAEGDYMLEAAGPSDRVPFRADEDGPHFLWVYQELFTRLRMRLPFSDFQRDVMTRCRVAVSQLHLNGWASFSLLRKCAYTSAFAPPSDFSSISMTFIFCRVVTDTSLSGRVRVGGYLTPMKNRFRSLNGITLRFILDGSDAEVGEFLDGLLDVKMKRTKLDDLMAKMANPSRMGPRPILPTSSPSVTATAAAVAAASASASDAGAAAGSPHVESSIQVPPGPTASDAKKAKKQPAKRDRSKVVDLEEELKEDPTADLQSKRRRKKLKVDEAFEKALGDDSAWEHEVDPLKVAFPENFDYRKALNAGLTSAPVREALTKMPPEQLLGESYHLHAKSLACLQEKATTLENELYEKKLEHQSALERIAQLEEDQRVLKAQFGSSQLSMETERKRAAAAEEQVVSLAASLKTCQADLSKATEASEYWRSEWHTLGSEVTDMCQETLDICLDQDSHLCPGVDLSAITLKSRWDPKGRRIFVPQETEVEVGLPAAEGVVSEQGPAVAARSSQPVAGDAAGEAARASGGCPT